ncbi:MAG: hypothetical protein RR387_00195 [Clostridiales bacterium]
MNKYQNLSLADTNRGLATPGQAFLEQVAAVYRQFGVNVALP